MNTPPSRRIALVTGATGIIGRAIVRKLADEGLSVVATGRDPEKLAAVMDGLRKEGDDIRPLVLDMASAESIGQAAKSLEGPLHVLINNASAVPLRREENSEGREMQFAVNILGYLRVIRAFQEALARGAEESGLWSRVVNVASFWAGDLDLEDLEFRRRPYNAGIAYRQSKQAERMLSVVLAEELAPRRIAVNAGHPGEVNTPLSNALGFGGYESPEEGADNPVWLALDASLEGRTGGWYEYRKKIPCRFAEDREGARRLYAILAE